MLLYAPLAAFVNHIQDYKRSNPGGYIAPYMAREFPEDEDWICPKLASYELLNDPFLFAGKNLVMVVNSCDVAAKIDAANNLSTYAKTGCADKAVINANIERVRALYKTLQKIFVPKFYVENGRQQSAITERGES